MGLKNRISKFSGKMTKEKWLLLLLVGVLLMILSFPLPGSRRTGKDGESRSGQVSRNEGAVPLWTGDAQENDQDAEPDQASLNGPARTGMVLTAFTLPRPRPGERGPMKHRWRTGLRIS